MSLQIRHVSSPNLPFTKPLPDGFGPGDQLQIELEMNPASCLHIKLKSSDAEKSDSQLPLCLLATQDNRIVLKSGQATEDGKVTKSMSLQSEIFVMTLTAEEKIYLLEIDGVCFDTFSHDYLPSTMDTLEIAVPTGAALVKSVGLTREVRWLGAGIGSPSLKMALKCGNDEFNNEIYLGRVFNNNSMKIVSVIPARKKAITAFDGREWLAHSFAVLKQNSSYGWKFISENKNIPKNAVEGGFDKNGDKVYIGRVKYEGAVILGTLYAKNGMLSLPFKGTEVEISQEVGYEVLVTLSPLKHQKRQSKTPPAFWKPPPNNCVICYTKEITTAFSPCGHLGFCESCAIELVTRTNKCPICQRDIESYLRIYKVV